MASYYNDLLADGNTSAADMAAATDYGNRGQTSSAPVAGSLEDYAAMLAASVEQGKKDVKALTDTSAVTAAKTEVATEKTSNAALAKSLGATISPTGMITPPTSGYTTQSINAAAGISTPPPVVAPTTPTSDSNALNALNALFAGYGFPPDFGNYIRVMFAAGYQDAATIANIAQNPKTFTSNDPAVQAAFNGLSQEWQARFSGNQLRMANGLDPLPASQYIANEQSYKQVMQMAGLPASTLSNDVLGKLMAQDVSPAEVQTRVNAALQAVQSEDPFVIQQLQTQHGMTLGSIALHLLDPTIAAPVIQQQVAAAQIGAEAARVGSNINQDYAMKLAGQGVTQGQAQQGFQSIATQQAALQAVANQSPAFLPAGAIGGALQTATFGTPGAQDYATAQAELARVKAAAANPFGGSSGVSKGSLMGSEEGIS